MNQEIMLLISKLEHEMIADIQLNWCSNDYPSFEDIRVDAFTSQVFLRDKVIGTYKVLTMQPDTANAYGIKFVYSHFK